MSDSILARFEGKTPDEVLETLSILLYEPPLSGLRDALPHLPDEIRIPLHVLDFDTEVTMRGILGYLENAPGIYLPDTISALRTIGAHHTAVTLERIEAILTRHGVTTADLRANVEEANPSELSSFLELHGEHLDAMSKEIEAEADALYLHVGEGEDVLGLLRGYLATVQNELIEILRGCAAR